MEPRNASIRVRTFVYLQKSDGFVYLRFCNYQKLYIILYGRRTSQKDEQKKYAYIEADTGLFTHIHLKSTNKSVNKSPRHCLFSGSRAPAGEAPSWHPHTPERSGQEVSKCHRADLRHHWTVPHQSENRYWNRLSTPVLLNTVNRMTHWHKRCRVPRSSQLPFLGNVIVK